MSTIPTVVKDNPMSFGSGIFMFAISITTLVLVILIHGKQSKKCKQNRENAGPFTKSERALAERNRQARLDGCSYDPCGERGGRQPRQWTTVGGRKVDCPCQRYD